MSPCYKQQPTLTNVRIRTAQDAFLVFYGVARGALTLLTRRLDADERKAIRPGHVYVWEDRSATTSDSGGLSMERWTDGMSWGPSRIREEFLFYYQRDPQGNERTSSSGARKKSNRPMDESDKLIKQTFSVYVSLAEDHPQDITRKWHLTAYFNQRTGDNLGRIDDIPNVGGLVVPDNLFRSARAVKGRKEDIRRSMGQIIGPVSEQSFSPSTGSGALYTIFPSNAQPEPMSSTRTHHSHSPESSYETSHSSIHRVPSSKSVAVPMQHSRSDSPESSSRSSYSPQQAYQTSQYASPAPYASPPSYAQSPTYPTASRARPQGPALVPLEYLQSIPPPRRDPADVLYLQRLSLSNTRDPSPSHSHPAFHAHSPSPDPRVEVGYRDAHRRYA